MSQRIVDEAFVRELEAAAAARPEDERFMHVRQLIDRSEREIAAAVKMSGLQRFLWRALSPLMAPIFEHQRALQREQLDLIATISADAATERENLRRQILTAYLKVGESLADLRASLVQHLEARVEGAIAEGRSAARDAVRGETENALENLRAEMRLIGQDLVARSDRLIVHLEVQIAALERDISRAGAAGEKRLDQMQSALRTLNAELQTVRMRLDWTSRPDSDGGIVDREGAGAPELITYTDERRNFRRDWLQDAAPVLVIGADRMEFLSLLHESGIEARGLENGEDDVVAALAELPAASFGAVRAAGITGMLSASKLQAFLIQVKRIVRHGGRLLIEANDPRSFHALLRRLAAGGSPVPSLAPELLQSIVEEAGFRDCLTAHFATPPDSERLLEVTLGGGMPREIEEAFTRLQDNFHRLDALLFGPGEYALVATA